MSTLTSTSQLARFPGRVSSLYEILSSILQFSEDGAFWWQTSGRILADMFEYLGYTSHSQLLHTLFFYARVLPYMGPKPGIHNDSIFKSYMTDDHTPIEMSWVASSDNTMAVRYSIEPFDMVSCQDPAKPQALRMINELQPILADLDLRWFSVLNETLIWRGGLEGGHGTKHSSQYFLGFDCARSGAITLKAYFLPELLSFHSGVPKEVLVTNALKALSADLMIPWEAILQYFRSLSHPAAPCIEIVATDCSAPRNSRIKVYVRTRSTNFADLEGLMTLGGRLSGPVFERAIAALSDLWNLVMGIDTSVDGWKTRSLSSSSSNGAADTHPTGGLLLYYELKPGYPLPFPKVYLPVRHYCSDDLAIAKGVERFYRKRGGMMLDAYTCTIQELFGRHRPLQARTGIHTYLSLAVKKTDYEVASYFNPEAYAPERVFK